ncbi:unnamed protein product [Fusarium equiseti]|uniref:Monocarboxylate transporter 4 n=1 Tax=Fusarium equiseti TaxID=61235 RepID=A0A8J2NAH9_FUSEQ|nr:unnamed protein product [Fusarium equiseti]
MAADSGDRNDPGSNLSAVAIPGPSIGGEHLGTPFLDALALDTTDGLTFDMEGDLWYAELSQLPVDINTPNSDQSQNAVRQHQPHLQQGPDLQPDIPTTQVTSSSTQVLHGPRSNKLDSPTPNSASTNSQINTPSTLPPKVGHRFTLEALRSLKEWFSAHVDNPYPTEEEKIILEHQTGLSRTQITNWLANARRRRIVADSRTNGSGQTPEEYTPTRSGTPIPRRGQTWRDLNPMQRWQNSPPENEPALVSDIARAMASGELVSTRGRRGTFSSDEKISRRRRHRSATSSLGTSRSASTDSRSSRGSISGTSSHSRGRSIQKIRPQKNSLTKPRFTFQCTFCTETFRRKYDWQRHENSLHLPLERWECSPNGTTAIHPDTGQMCCLFCGHDDPSETHLASHNPSACQERAFSRKDHLKQHLRLVHNAVLTDLTTKLWKTTQPDIVSRCGFCQASLSTWPDRVDHLANHFKLGCTMRSWVGDWGFEDSVLKTIENGMPPYLVELERGTPFPFTANGRPPDSPRSAYELITMELAYFIQSYNDTTDTLPSHRTLQLEACRIVFGSEVTFPELNPGSRGGSSWLRDLLLSSDEIVQQARFAPIRSRAESRLSVLRIKGKNALFEECPLEARLQAFMRSQRAQGIHAISDHELQREAGRIVLQMESELHTKPEYVANWLIGFLNYSTSWIGEFRRRAASVLANDNNEAPSTSRGASWQDQLSAQSQPDALPWTRQASWPTGIDWELVGHGDLAGTDMSRLKERGDKADSTPADALLQDFTWLWSDDQSPPVIPQTNDSPNEEGQSTLRPTWLGPGIYVLNDPNHIPWFAREMKRWVKATMSPNNPICHVPSDEELRHQARCLLYNDDDPWNQTPADNAQWLDIFKKEAGII